LGGVNAAGQLVTATHASHEKERYAMPNGPKDTNGLPTAYIQGPRFGQATNDNQFPQPYPGQNGGRAFRIAFGVRF
jgi:hypothetical protein